MQSSGRRLTSFACQPSVLTSVGLVPGIILIFTVAALSTFCAYIIGLVKKAHPSVYTVAEFVPFIPLAPHRNRWTLTGLYLQRRLPHWRPYWS